MDYFGLSDPYVKITLVTKDDKVPVDDVDVRTKTKKKTLYPTWDEEFLFRVNQDEHKLVLEVLDEDRLCRDDSHGMF